LLAQGATMIEELLREIGLDWLAALYVTLRPHFPTIGLAATWGWIVLHWILRWVNLRRGEATGQGGGHLLHFVKVPGGEDMLCAATKLNVALAHILTTSSLLAGMMLRAARKAKPGQPFFTLPARYASLILADTEAALTKLFRNEPEVAA